MLIKSTAPTFTRPSDTTQYAALDLVANSTTAASVVALQFKFDRAIVKSGFRITRGTMVKSDTDIVTATFALHLFKATPTFSTNGDNSAMSGNTTGAASWLGTLTNAAAISFLADDVAQFTATDATGIMCTVADFTPAADGTISLYGCLSAIGTYTPGSAETFSVTIYGETLDGTH